MAWHKLVHTSNIYVCRFAEPFPISQETSHLAPYIIVLSTVGHFVAMA